MFEHIKYIVVAICYLLVFYPNFSVFSYEPCLYLTRPFIYVYDGLHLVFRLFEI